MFWNALGPGVRTALVVDEAAQSVGQWLDSKDQSCVNGAMVGGAGIGFCGGAMVGSTGGGIVGRAAGLVFCSTGTGGGGGFGGGAKTEGHHLLPRQFKEFFRRAGLDIEDFVIDLSTARHRLKPGGVHTGKSADN